MSLPPSTTPFVSSTPLQIHLFVKGTCRMAEKCRFTHSEAEAMRLRQMAENNGGVFSSISAFRGKQMKVSWIYLKQVTCVLPIFRVS